MTDYRYIFGSLRDEKIIAEIPLSGTYVDLELNVGGRFDGVFYLDQTGFDNATLLDATIPGRTFVAVERAGNPIWIGFVWSRVYQSQAKVVQIYAQSFENYPQYQLVRSTFDQTDEQLTIFKNLWSHMQAVNGRNMNIQIPTSTPPTVVTKTVTIAPTDFKYYGEAISSISDAANGFDWYIGVSKTGNQYNKSLVYGYPTLGSVDPRGITFEYPGGILNYYATETMSTAATNVFTLGAGEGESMLFYEAANDSMITSGFPRWDMTIGRKDLSTADAVEQVGRQEGTNRKPPMLIIKPGLKGERAPEFGSFGLGDACNVTIQDARFPRGLMFNGRIVKWTLQPTSSDNTEEYTVIFEGDDESA